jgi:hypothetical protein
MTMASAESAGHARDIELRRLRGGELDSAERTRLEGHLTGCPPCRAKLGALEEEQHAFTQELSFERFAGGVERAARMPDRQPRGGRLQPRALVLSLGLSLAVAAALVLVLRPHPAEHNGIKGAAVEASLRIGAGDGRAQRAIAAGGTARLTPGDLLRVGYRSDGPRYLVALSIDDQGMVSALYPERGPGLAVGSSATLTYLPDAIALEGKGRERVFVVLSPQALTVEAATAAVQAAHQRAGGQLAAMAPPALPGEVFTWLLEKP